MKEWLVTPLNRNPNNNNEVAYNRNHKSTRRIIECSYGILKQRFPCLNYLRLEPISAGKVVMACSVLHNVATKDDFEYDATDQYEPEVGIGGGANPDRATEQRIRELLDYFS